MSFRKYIPPCDAPSGSMKSLNLSGKANQNSQPSDTQRSTEADVDIDMGEVYFLIMHFLSAGPCHRTYGQFWNELLEHQLLPRRYHAWYSRSGALSGDENDDGRSFPLSYNRLVERYSHVGKDHLVKLLKQLLLSVKAPPPGMLGGNTINAAAVPTLLGTGSFSLLSSDQDQKNVEVKPPGHLRWPHMLVDQLRGLSLREIGGGFSKHHRAPSIRAACYAIAKPSTMVQKMQNIKKVRGHRNAVYCAIFDRSGRYVITGSDDRLVKIWSMETAYCLASCRGHEGDITDLAVNSNNTLVASASNDCIIRVWRLPDGLPISVLRGHTGAVTAIAFSPRPSSVYQLLSSSDDGTCRIWDARYSQFNPRLYIPKPPETVAGKNTGPSSSTVLQSHQIFCCAFNNSGTFFVTGSSDTCARVWNACKSNSDDSEQPNHEIEILSGHENDVNYVQFSGCAAASRFSSTDASKEDCVPKFKNSCFRFNHDNIVTCSRDGSAIIWIPRSRRSHGKGGRWQKAYHLKVPPPPMPPQPPRGGPRQRILPTPRGVNMIVWSLDNRFVLAAIMDCRICVWNAVDGSLVHSLTGHTESTYVLDVHPSNPRIAMSAGYDGKTIVWDIWEGAPIRTYEIGRFKLVDGKFSPDGTSIILSDDVGQLYILNTGQGESQKDAKYDQFFLGDYRPVVQDTNGNVLDQETQLAPYRRNMQDLLCDAGMIPYPEPYQSMYQRRRLGALGIEWRPSSFRFSIGTDFNMDQQYQTFPIIDLEMLIEPLPGFVDAMDWEPEIEIQSDESDSEYHVTEEYSSGKEQGSFCSDASANPEISDEDSEAEDNQKDALRRSRRKKQTAEVEVTTSSGRRVKRKNLDECENSSHRINRSRKSRHGQKAKRKSSSKSLRPQRAAARNALHLFSRITGTSTEGEDEYGSEGDSSDSESTLQDSNNGNEDSDVSLNSERHGHSKGKEICVDHSDETDKLQPFPNFNGIRRRLVLKLPNRDSSKYGPLKNYEPGLAGPSLAPEEAAEVSQNYFGCEDNNLSDANGDIREKSEINQPTKIESHLDLLEGCKDGNIKWGGVKSRSTKRSRMGELLPSGSETGPSSFAEGSILNENVVNGHSMLEKEHHRVPPCSGIQNETNGIIHVSENHYQDAIQEEENVKLLDGTDSDRPFKQNATPVPMRLIIRSKILSGHLGNCDKIDTKTSLEDSGCTACDTVSEFHDTEKVISSEAPTEEDSRTPTLDDEDREKKLDADNSGGTFGTELQVSQQVRSHDMMFSAVYRRSKFGRGRNGREGVSGNMEATTSNVGSHSLAEGSEAIIEGVRRTRSIRLRSKTCDVNPVHSNDRLVQPHDGSEGTSVEKTAGNRDDESSFEEQLLGSASAVGLRSTRTRRGSYYAREPSPPDRRKSYQAARSSWLMLVAHEEGSRYIPQRGDEIVYLRQGHEEYISQNNLRDLGPWKTIKGKIRAVEFCMVENLEFKTRPGSGESCAKMTLKFVDPASDVVGKSFQLTLPEVTGFPDFLVERTRYDAAIERNWTSRDKCQVWWKNEGEEDGSWWEGRILNVQAKSHEFPDSPWERYIVRYKSDPSETHQHSPWELYDANTQWEQPRIDDETRDKLMHAFTKLEKSGNKPQDYYGVEKLRQVSHKSNFINRFPVPLSLETIRARLENNYYRSLEGMKHDIEVMLSNAESYCGRNVELATKVRRLSEWFRRTLSSL